MPGAELNEPRRGPTPLPGLSQMDPKDAIPIIAIELDRIRSLIEEERGRAPNLVIFEFDVTNGLGNGRMATVDYDPDRWVIWFRVNANVTLRVSPGGSVPADPISTQAVPGGAFEIASGQRVIVSNRNRQMSFVNTGSVVGHVFAVAVGGGAEFDISA